MSQFLRVFLPTRDAFVCLFCGCDCLVPLIVFNVKAGPVKLLTWQKTFALHSSDNINHVDSNMVNVNVLIIDFNIENFKAYRVRKSPLSRKP